MDTRSACYSWWNSNTKSISLTITAEREERDNTRGGEAFQEDIRFGKEEKTNPHRSYWVHFQHSVSRVLGSIAQVCAHFKSSHCISADSVCFKVTYICNWLLQASRTRLISNFHHFNSLHKDCIGFCCWLLTKEVQPINNEASNGMTTGIYHEISSHT